MAGAFLKMSVKCGVCDNHTARYRCPSCQLQQYVSVIISQELDRLKTQSCSIECYKSHQIIHIDTLCRVATHSISNGLPPKPPAAVALTGTSNSYVGGRAPPSPTSSPSSLESSADLQILYTRHPQLRDQLKEIYEAATEPLDDQLSDQLFSNERGDRGRGRGRDRRQGRDGRKLTRWSQQKGIKSGIQRLRLLRDCKGEDGDRYGLKEFSNLVTSPLEAKESKTRVTEI